MQQVIQSFSGTLPKGFRGNLLYHMELPKGLAQLTVRLTVNKEHVEEPAAYAEQNRQELQAVLKSYLGRQATEEELLAHVKNIKTEVQLCLFINEVFVGNVHKPGLVKEMTIAADSAADGCLPCARLWGSVRIIVNVFGVAEEETGYQLELKGGFADVETD